MIPRINLTFFLFFNPTLQLRQVLKLDLQIHSILLQLSYVQDIVTSIADLWLYPTNDIKSFPDRSGFLRLEPFPLCPLVPHLK